MTAITAERVILTATALLFHNHHLRGMDPHNSDIHEMSDAAHNISDAVEQAQPQTSADSQAQQPQTQDVPMHFDEYDDMPGLQEVSDSSDDDSDDNRDANEVEMQDYAQVESGPSAFTSQPSLSSSSSVRNSNRRARVDDDDDADRDRRHPSQRVSNNGRAGSSARLQPSTTPGGQQRLGGVPNIGLEPRLGAQPWPPFATTNDEQAFRLFEQLMRNQATPVPNQAGQNNNNAYAPTNPPNPAHPHPHPQQDQQEPPTNTGGNHLPGAFFDGVIDIQIGPEIVFGRNGPQEHTQPVEGPRTADGQAPQPPPPSIADQARAGILADLMRSISQIIPGADIDGNGVPIINLGNFNLAFGGAQEKEDPERAKKLVDGLEVVPVGLVRRLERVGGTGGGMGEEMANGGDAGCAICWDKLLDGDGEGFGKEKEEEKSETLEGGVKAKDEETKEEGPNEQVSAESKYPKIVSLPCAHVFHADCLIPWFSRPRHTTCPTCRFNIDPDNLTYTSMRSRPRTAAAPPPATTVEGEQPALPEGDQVPPPGQPAANAAGNVPQPSATNVNPDGVDFAQSFAASFGGLLNRIGAGLPLAPTGGQQQGAPNPDGEQQPQPNPAPAGNPAPPRLGPPRISVNIIPVVVPVNGARGAPQQTPNGNDPAFRPPPAGQPPATPQVPNADAPGNLASPAGQNALADLLLSHIRRQNNQQPQAVPFNSLFPPHFFQQSAAATGSQPTASTGSQPVAAGGNELPIFGTNPSIPLGDDPTRPLPVFRRVTYRGPGPFFNRALPGSPLPYRVVREPPVVVSQPIADSVRAHQLSRLASQGSSTQPQQQPTQSQEGTSNAAPANSTIPPGPPPAEYRPTQPTNPRSEFLRFTIDMIVDGPMPPFGNDEDLPPLIDSPDTPDVPQGPGGHDDVMMMIEQNVTELDRLMGNMDEVDEFMHLMEQQHQQDVEFIRLRAQTAATNPQPAAQSTSPLPTVPQQPPQRPHQHLPNTLPPLLRGMGNGVHFAAGAGRTIHEAFNQLFATPFGGQPASQPPTPAGNADLQPPHPAEGAVPNAQQPHPQPQAGQVPPALHMFGDIFGGPRRERRSRPKGPWTLPPAPGPTLRQRIERREREAGLRCYDVSCGIGPSDEDLFAGEVPNGTAAMKQLTIKSKEDKSEVCVHRFHGPCLVTAERVALKGADAVVEDGNVEVSCPVCRHVGYILKEEWDEGVVALT